MKTSLSVIAVLLLLPCLSVFAAGKAYEQSDYSTYCKVAAVTAFDIVLSMKEGGLSRAQSMDFVLAHHGADTPVERELVNVFAGAIEDVYGKYRDLSNDQVRLIAYRTCVEDNEATLENILAEK